MIKFFKCRTCGNVIVKAVDSTITPYCCGKEMEELKPNTVDASHESHVPDIARLDYFTLHVTVGKTPHPMTYEHHISFICLETTRGYVIRYLSPCRAAECYFLISDDVIAIYAYCNVHGLWKLPLREKESEECRKEKEKARIV